MGWALGVRISSDPITNPIEDFGQDADKQMSSTDGIERFDLARCGLDN